MLTDRRWHSGIFDVQPFRGDNCDTDHYVVIAKVRKRLSVKKQEALNSNMERFNLKQLNEMEVKKEYQIDISNRFVALGNLNDNKNKKGLGKTLKRISKSQIKKY
jgi:hypothetical protein